MKTLIVLSLILTLSSCDDDDKLCFECTTQIVTLVQPGNTTSTTSKMQYCGKTEDEREGIEEAGTNTTTSVSGNVTTQIQKTTTCRKK
jgi:hypothetical protein